jgi:murein L,D-transpeptidase YcbB/YkuD
MPVLRTALVALTLLCVFATGRVAANGNGGADDGFATALRARIEAIDASGHAVVAGTGLLAPTLLSRFYRERDYRPLWQPAGSEGGPRIDELLRALEDARVHGLDPDAYHATQLARLAADPTAAADLELLATDAFVRHAWHRAHGRIAPADADPEWFLFVTEADPPTLLGQLASSIPVGFLLDGLWPEAPQYWRLVEEKRRLLARGATPSLPIEAGPIAAGPLLRLGRSNPRVPALRARLGLRAGSDDRFDAELDAAVRAFQQSQGLAVDGVVGPNTLDLLNVTDAERITRIDVNLERWRWLMRALPATRVQVNVADYTLQVFEAGQEALRMNVIVGTPFRRTPVFTEPMRYLVFNPDWRVPRRIAVEDKLRLLQKDAAALAAQGYEARRANSPDPLQPVDAFDWSTVTPRTFDYLLRQRPGANNALGRVKFILPNPYSVYLHDTPARELFARSGRAFSSGCIRLEHAMLLADWVLRDQPTWTRERIDAVLEAGEPVEVPLRQPLPVLVLYFTVVAGESGTIYYRPDLYGRDAKVAAALEGRGGSAAAGPG